MNWIDILSCYVEWWEYPYKMFTDLSKIYTGGRESWTPNKHQKELLSDLRNFNISKLLVSANREGGKTVCLAVACLWYASVLSMYVSEPIYVAILSGSKEQSMAMYGYINKFIQHPAIKYRIKRSLKDAVYFYDGSWIKALPKSLESSLGKHVHLLVIDEAVLLDWDVYKAVVPLVKTSPYSKFIVCSTADIQGGGILFFMELWNSASKRGFKRYEGWSMFDCHWISDRHINFFRQEFGEDSVDWLSKVLGKPTLDIGGLFKYDDIKRCIVDSTSLGGGIRYMGIDWGLRNPTVVTLVECVGDYCSIIFIKSYVNTEFDVIIRDVRKWVKEYNVHTVFADSSHIHTNQRLSALGVNIIPIPFVKYKTSLIHNLRKAISKHRIKIPSEYSSLISQLVNYSWDTKRDDDYVDSLMCALAFKVYYEKSQEDRDIFKKLYIASLDEGLGGD